MSRNPSRPVLPEDLVHEILVRLPVKLLLQLKCVCKSWLTLISNPQFARDHYLRTSIMTHQRLAFFVNRRPNEVVTCSVQSLIETPSTPAETVGFRVNLGREYDIIGSINGLLCLYDNGGRFRVWNPCSRLKSRRSPHAFPGEFIKHCGFGYDKVKDKYKVVALARVGQGKLVKTVAKVFTFGESSWTTIDEDLPFGSYLVVKYGEFASGNVHWLTEEKTDSGKVIRSFDMENETHGQVLLPRQLDDHHALSLHGSNDRLYVCQFFQTHWVLWLMRDCGVQESWTIFTTIPQEMSFTNCALLFFPLSILENGVVLMKTTCSHSHLVILYNSNDGTFSRCKISGDQHGKNTGVYLESIVPPP